MMEYALYKGEKFITCGTIKEISDELGISEQTVKFYGTNVSKKRYPNGRVLVEIGEMEHEN